MEECGYNSENDRGRKENGVIRRIPISIGIIHITEHTKGLSNERPRTNGIRYGRTMSSNLYMYLCINCYKKIKIILMYIR